MVTLLVGLILLLVVAVGWIFQQNKKLRDMEVEVAKMDELLANSQSHREEIQKDLAEKNKLLEVKENEIGKFFNSVDVTAFTYDRVKKILDIAKGVEEIYGYSQEEFIKTPTLWQDVIHPDDKKHVLKKFRKLKSGEKVIIDHRIIRPDHKVRWVSLRVTVVLDSFGSPEEMIGVVLDITHRKHMEQKLKQLAYHDELTNLPNRTMLKNHLKKAMARSRRNDHDLTMMFIDLDGFKNVNDTLGHDAGDELLRQVAIRLEDIVREEDLVARHGGDEFIVVFENTGENEVKGIAERIVEGLSDSYEINGETASISPSIGISIYPKDGDDVDLLIHNADKAMYAVKCNGKSGYEFYSPEHEHIEPKKTVIEKFVDLFTK